MRFELRSLKTRLTMSDDWLERVQKFRSKPTRTTPVRINRKSIPRRTKGVAHNDYRHFKELNPLLSSDLSVVFVGFNPGVESSKSQHHYAHHTNLFWKLFNETRILVKVLESRHVDLNRAWKSDPLLQSLILNPKTDGMKSAVKPVHDFDLIKYHIGFTDLCLRCTKSANELRMGEKMDNIPRLLAEFKSSKSQKIVIIGKGIWEVFIKYIQRDTNQKQSTSFEWGKQNNHYTEWLRRNLDYDFEVHVLPSTSGLVTSLKYHEKLALWNQIF